MGQLSNPELKRAINRQAQALATQSFSVHRVALEQKARALLADGKTLEQTIAAIQFDDLRTRLGRDLV